TLACSLAHAVRDDRHLHAQVRADDENALPRLDIRDAHTEQRRRGIRRLVAEVALPQPVVDVAAAEVAGDAREQVLLLDRRARRHERAELVAATLRRVLQRRDGRYQRVLPRHLRPLAVALDAGLKQAIVAVNAIATVAVAVGD